MIHRGLLFWSIAAVATAVGLFTVKYKVQDLEEKIDRTNQKIIESQQATHILKVEWAHLNEAERIEKLAQKHLKLEPANIKQVTRLDILKNDSNQQRRDPPLPSPTNGQRRPLVDCARWWSRLRGGRQPLAGLRTPSGRITTGPTTPPRPALAQAPAITGPVGDGQVATTSIDEILSKKEGYVGEVVAQIWPARPGRRVPAAAGARYGSEKERLKGDVQETARQRLVVTSAIFIMVFCAVGLRMGYVSLLRDGAEPTQRVAARGGSIQSERADIVDRNGVVFATSVPVMSAFVNPHLLLDTADAARKIVSALPEIKYEEIKEKLDGDKSFIWIKRGLSPREHFLVNRLGIPGLRVDPHHDVGHSPSTPPANGPRGSAGIRPRSAEIVGRRLGSHFGVSNRSPSLSPSQLRSQGQGGSPVATGRPLEENSNPVDWCRRSPLSQEKPRIISLPT